MENKEKVFANKIDKNINNNEKVYYSNLQKTDKIKEIKKNNKVDKNINQKINSIFNSRNYVYKADVIIKTEKSNIKKTIIGRNRNFLITQDNELIAIKDIMDINEQEKNSF